ncbi:acetyl-CoA carboxylase carboxyltransferase subunit alpha [Schaedlerella arabinosiphila]|nr:acetyl-CoA carboxylase carboxyltransferase subunit alpha [Schaedlerella arabinosiphila]
MKKCKVCGTEYEEGNLRKKRYICTSCGYHFRIPAKERIRMIADKGTFAEWFEDLDLKIPIEETYAEKLAIAREKTGIREAVVVGEAKVLGEKIAIGVCDSFFIMGSMGHVVGEKITRLVEAATENKLPVFIFCCSGGARMQEGIISLMQMEKTAAALGRHDREGLFSCTILTDPTTGGVTASFAMLGDVIMAEPGATVGFAGKRVIKQTIGEELPKGFQTSEFIEEHGMIDGIVQRKRLRQMIQFLSVVNKQSGSFASFTNGLNSRFYQLSQSYAVSLAWSKKTPWEKVRENRKIGRPATVMFIRNIFDVFVELKGDRLYRDDPSIVGGIALLDGQPVTVIAEYRGITVEENLRRNFGMPNPEGYRKALRLMKQAEKFGRPIISFINTQGAYCGVGAEERGQGTAIARNLLEMSRLKVPILAIIVGEAGSGGALATAVGDEVWMFENATYSIITPEGYASILWGDSSRAPEAAEKMHITAQDLKKKKIIDKIIPEYGGANMHNVRKISEYIKVQMKNFLLKKNSMDRNEMVEERYKRFRKY